jgi:hypothetical protein
MWLQLNLNYSCELLDLQGFATHSLRNYGQRNKNVEDRHTDTGHKIVSRELQATTVVGHIYGHFFMHRLPWKPSNLRPGLAFVTPSDNLHASSQN